MIDAVAIMGPTGVGKSDVAVKLALELEGEVISVDSRQAYRYLDIGTAKPTKKQMRGIPHHLIDVLDLQERNNAEYYARMVFQKMDEIRGRKKLPILAGGTGLYFRAVFEGLFDVELDGKEREKFADSVKNVDTSILRERLREVDLETYKRLGPNDRYRIVRALEVYELTGVPLSEHFRRQSKRNAREGCSFLKIALNLERSELYRRIERRTKEMFRAGWIEEVRGLLAMGVDPDWPGMKTMGYPEIVDFLGGKITMEDLIERVTTLTRRYAKRQLTWFRKERDVFWFGADEENLVEKLTSLVREHMCKR